MPREALVRSQVPTTGNRSLLRRINALGILDRLRDGPRTLGRLAGETGLSRTATEAVVTDLMQAGWTVAAPRDPEEATGQGRPAVRYAFAADAGHVASIDIGAHHIAVVIADLVGEVAQRLSQPVAEDLPAADRVASAKDLLMTALDRAQLGAGELWAVGIGSPGAITDGRVVHFGGRGMPDWAGTDLGAAFRTDVDCPVLVEGDCALGAVAERWLGAAQEAADVVYVLCGNRTSAAVIAGGRLHRGAHGSAGRVGELAELRWRELELEQYGASAYGPDRPSRQEIFDQARAGHPAALRAVADFAEVLGLGTAAMVLAVDPELVVIGGTSAADGDVFLDHVGEVLPRRCPTVPAIVTSSLGGDAVGLGGVRLCLDRIDASLAAAVRSAEAFPAATPAAARFGAVAG